MAITMPATTNADVTARINDVKSFVTTQLTAAESFLATLDEIANMTPPYMTTVDVLYTPENPDLGESFNPTVTPQTIENKINSLGSEIDNIQAPSIVENFDELTIDLPTQADIDAITIPSEDDFAYTEVEYASDLLAILKNKLAADVVGGTGLAPAIEDAIWLRDEERFNLAQQAAIDTAVGAWAARGFSMPAGVVQDAVDEIVEKSRMDRITRSRDIMIKQADLTQKNVQAAIANGINLENILISHHDRVQDRALAAAKTVIEIGIAIMDAQVRRLAAITDLSKTEIEAYVAIEKFKLDKYATSVQVFVQKSQIALGQVKAYTDLFQSEAEIYKADLSKAEAFARLALSNNELSLSNQQTNLKVGLEAVKTNMQIFMEAAKLKGAVSESGAKIYAGAVTSALNSVNAVINLASSGVTSATGT
jgi:hypothetical protein